MAPTDPVPRPRALLAELTYRCPLQCPYCSNPPQIEFLARELDTAEWQRVLAEASALGVVQAQFSGGEPLARRDLEDLIVTCTQLGMSTYLATGGTLVTACRLEALQRAGLRAVQVSVQAADPVANDGIAGTRSFDAKARAVALARAAGLHVTLNCVLHRANVEQVPDMIALAKAWGVDRLELAHTQYVGWAFENRAALLPRREQVEAAIAQVARARAGRQVPEITHVLPDWYQDVPKPCLGGWGRVHLTIAPDGAVLPCQAARTLPGFQFANVRDASLGEIWFMSEAFTRFRGTAWMPEPCRGCDRREIDFGGCRCQAFLLAGDAAATDPVCARSPLHGRVRAEVERCLEPGAESKLLRRRPPRTRVLDETFTRRT
jgi:pyrroloquinoline quinone biosynthesis protein E